MRQVTVTELKDKLSQLRRLVKAGETVEITERSVPIALLTRRSPTSGRGLAPDRLIRDGLVVAPTQPPDIDAIRLPPVPCGGDVVVSLVEERGDR